MGVGLLVLLGLVCLASSSLIRVPGELHLTSSHPQRLSGSFTKDGRTISFSAQPAALNLTTTNAWGIQEGEWDQEAVLLGLVDYGAFMHVRLGERDFLLRTSPSPAESRYLTNPGAVAVIDITNRAVELPYIDPSVQPKPDDNLRFFINLFSQEHQSSVQASESILSGHMLDFIQMPEVENFVYLSLALAEQGINGKTHPASLTIHMPVLRVIKHRQDLKEKIDVRLTKHLNAINDPLHFNGTTTVAQDQGCTLTDVCGNACFGRCGPGCTCWSWVCGDCDCHLVCIPFLSNLQIMFLHLLYF